ncbi:DUF2059 domain-containing protein [Psychrobacter sp. H7-1]|uniref:DUF2059 domain-containing protein n=1 Tax=Psychrobacter sp. H7-1 TaxID=1569265 RepID=UPI0019190223|nr:DUF2059 domain-containing protein [Psychrobacter sp. H7-1]
MSISHPFLTSASKPLLRVVLVSAMAAASVIPAQAELIISSTGSSAANQGVATQPADLQAPHDVQLQKAQSNQVPSEALVIKLMQVMHIDDQIDAIVNGQQAARDILNSQEDKAANDTAGLNKRQRELAEGLQGILAQYGKVLGTRMSSTASREELTAAYISAARAHYTQQEVQAQIGFYDTPVGQSILAKNPKVSADFLQAALPSEEEMQQTRGELEQMLPQIKQIFKDVF